MKDTDALCQRLADAGCSDTMTTQCISLMEQGQEKEGFALLARHRKTLLEHCHAAERKIDCLDYLVYQVEKRTKHHQGGMQHGRKADPDSGMG